MITMPVRQVNRGKVLATYDDPIQQGLRLVDRQKCIDKDSISFSVEERRRVRHPARRVKNELEALQAGEKTGSFWGAMLRKFRRS